MKSRALYAVALALIATLIVWAAPARSTGDEIVGEFWLGDSAGPIVAVPGPDENSGQEYWLVFTDHKVEGAIRDVQPGDQVRARGTLGVGGGWKYLVVTALKKKE